MNENFHAQNNSRDNSEEKECHDYHKLGEIEARETTALINALVHKGNAKETHDDDATKEKLNLFSTSKIKKTEAKLLNNEDIIARTSKRATDDITSAIKLMSAHNDNAL